MQELSTYKSALNFSTLFKESFDFVWSKWPMLWVMTLLRDVISLGCASAVFALTSDLEYWNIVLAIFTGWWLKAILQYPVLAYTLTLCKGEKPGFKTLLPDQQSCKQLFIATTLMSLGILAGCVLLIIPGLVLMLFLPFTLAAIVDKRANTKESIRESVNIARANFGQVLTVNLIYLSQLLTIGILGPLLDLILHVFYCKLYLHCNKNMEAK